ncbi:MAG: glycosyltransferase [Sedimentisphaerales bacterium]|nr:glycosyltransferase [Sedimentisphaerales bacterium]
MITYAYYPATGGGIRYQKDVVDYFRAKGNIVDVLSVSSDNNMRVESCAQGSVIELPKLATISSAVVSIPYYSLFGKLASGYDILHFNFPNPIAEIAAVRHRKKLRHVKKIVFYHADIVPAKRFSGLYNKLITKRFLKLMDQILVSSPKMAEFSPHLQSFRQKVTVIPFGIDVNYYVPSAPNRLSDDKVSPRILFVGRLARYKGLEYLIQAMKDAPGRLSIVGSGPLKEMLVKLRDSLGLAERIDFCGYVSEQELLQKYQQADILVLPSTDAGEAFGYVLIEAMACRTAIISTELNTGTSYVNVDGQTGFVVPPKNVEALSKAIKSLSEKRDMLTRFKDNALRRAHEHFSLPRMLGETEDLYNI